MIDRTTIETRRDALAAQLDQARAQYDQLEAALRQLDRQLCAMQGGVQELDALLSDADSVNGFDASLASGERTGPLV